MTMHRQRLEKLAKQIHDVGLAGGDMQSKLAEVVDHNDLTSHEIQRVAEMANRSVQSELYKKASDKRFAFKLCDPEPLKAAARKHAEDSTHTAAGDAQKVAQAITEGGGDPFAVPYREPRSFSLYEHNPDPAIDHEMKTAETRRMLIELDQKRRELESMQKVGEADSMTVANKVGKTVDEMVQAALDMISGGVTLPSLYEAVMAAVAGSRAPKDAKEDADALMLAVVNGLKKRGLPNVKMGFRHQGDQDAIEAMSAAELVERCAKVTGHAHPEHDISHHDVSKTAKTMGGMGPTFGRHADSGMMQRRKLVMANKRPGKKHASSYEEGYVGDTDGKPDKGLLEDADDFFSMRPSQGKQPQSYLDDATVGNTPGGGPKIVNAENEFVTKVYDLVGAQDRMVRLHSAQEYIGLKLKQISDAMRGLNDAQKGADAKFASAPSRASSSSTMINLPKKSAGMAGVPAGPGLLEAGKKILSHPATTNAVGLAGIGAAVAPMVMNRDKEKIANPLLGAAVRGVAGKVMGALSSPAAGNAIGLAQAGAAVAPMLSKPKQQPQAPTAPQPAPAM